MALPPYRLPALKYLLIQMWIKAQLYLKKASTAILLASVIIWTMTSFPALPANADNSVSQIEHSLAGRLGKTIEPVFKPLGFDWKISIALVTGIAAKEIVISTLGTIYALENSETVSLPEQLRQDSVFTLPTALSLLVFVLLYVPCLAATVVFHKEAGNIKYTGIYFFYTCGLAWLAALLTQKISCLFL